MSFQRVISPAIGAMLILTPAVSIGVQAQEATQILDRVSVFNETAFLEMAFDDPNRLADFEVVFNDPQANFTACKLTATDGIWCLDGKRVVNTPNPADPSTSVEVLHCDDRALNLDTRPENTCTGLTVDNTGAIYLAGKNKGKSHSLFKIVALEGGQCPDGFTALANSPDLCASELANGRPLLVDINPIDGDAAEDFSGGKGTLGLEERKTIVFFPDVGEPVEIGSGKKDLKLNGNEQLLSVGLIQTADGQGGIINYALVTTSHARIIAVEMDGTPDARPVFDIAHARDLRSGTTLCAPGDENFGIRSSSKSGIIYVTDRTFCEVSALQPVTSASGDLIGLANIQENGSDLVLSTTSNSGTYPPTGPTLAPGIVLNLANCDISCIAVVGDDGTPAAVLFNVTVVGSETGLTLFQIQGIPDCRFVPVVCASILFDRTNLDPNSASDVLTAQNLLKSQGVILDMPGGNSAAAQLLNVKPLLPREVTDLVTEGLPDLWIPRWYTGQEINGYLFDSFFGITDASFAGVFELEVFVQKLTGRGELGCRVGDPNNTPISTLRRYDVAVKVSEKFRSVDRSFIPGSDDHEATLINIGCGTSRNGFERWSLVPVNMEFTPDTFDEFNFDVTSDDPALFLKLLGSLFSDLGTMITELACQPADGQSIAPLSQSDCDNLLNHVQNTGDKLDKCISATVQPKTSLRDQNCQAADSQLNNLADTASALTATGDDPANRLGEIGLRIMVVRNVFENLFIPSIPDEGF